MPPKPSVKPVKTPKSEAYQFVSLSDIDGSVVLKMKEDGKDVVCHRGNSKVSKDWRRILTVFFNSLNAKRVDQLRIYGVQHHNFGIVRMSQNDFAISSIVFDRSTNLDVLFDIIPVCSILKHVTLRGCTKYPYEKRHYAIRVHNSEINPFETTDFIYLRQTLFSKDSECPNDPKFFPKKLLLRPYRYDTEFFVRYYLTPKSLSELTSYNIAQGGCYYQKDWMVYNMNQNKQLFCKYGINGVYCVVVPAGSVPIKRTPLEQFVSNDDNYDIAELLDMPEEVNERKETPLEWNSLSDEMKQLCIGKMHFKTRINLRSTCHAERKLVDSSEPYKFKFVRLEHLTYSDNSQTMSVVAQNAEETLNVRSERWVESGKHNDTEAFGLTISAIKHILQFCEVEGFFMYPGANEHGMNELLNELSACGPFRISTFFSNVLNPAVQLFVIKNNITNMEMVYLRVTKSFTPKSYYEVSQVMNCKRLQFHLDKPGADTTNAVHMLITKWIAMNAEIGKTAVFGILDRLFSVKLGVLASKFKKGVISKTDEMVVLRTDDKAKHVLIFMYDDHDEFTYLACRMISSALKESEYEIYDRPWVDEYEVVNDFQKYDEEDDDYSNEKFE